MSCDLTLIRAPIETRTVPQVALKLDGANVGLDRRRAAAQKDRERAVRVAEANQKLRACADT